MNKRPGKNTLQASLDSIYVEAIRHGTFVTLLVMTLISGGVGYIVYGYVLGGWAESQREYQRQVAAKGLENKKTEAMLAGETHFRAEFKKVADLFDEAKPLLPEETEVSDVIAQVESAAKRNGVTLTGLVAVTQSVKSPQAGKLYEREIPAVVSGSFPKVVSFFADISRMPRILLVRDYSIISLKNSVSAGFTLVAYHAPPPAEVPARPKEIAWLDHKEQR
jgi:Tfp pilus assembly protein PilO